ncbi:MAG: disulfide bond formation protein B [Alphaproteobacteria bacterium]
MSGAGRAALIALVGSSALTLGALGFQYLADLPPCPLCIEQRIPHLAAILFGLLGFVGDRNNTAPGFPLSMSLLAALALIVTGLMGVNHAGIEYGWWAGPDSCTQGASAGTIEDLMAQIERQSVVMCDEAPWTLLNISLAGYNALISLGLSALVLREAMKK